MGKYRNHREPQRNSFDGERNDGDFEPSYFQRSAPAPRFVERAMTAPATAGGDTPVDAEVVWFNAAKGFGFVKLGDGTDAYLSVTKLRAVGHSDIAEGTKLTVKTEPGNKGSQVAEVLAVVGARGGKPAGGSRTNADQRSDMKQELESVGTVRFYNAERGFGFVSLDGAGQDAFVHATALARAGLTTLAEGNKVTVQYAQGQKGLEVRAIRLD